MKKLLAILLIAFFAVGFSSCAEESIETDPLMPEIDQETVVQVQDKKSGKDMRRGRNRGVLKSGSGS